MPVNINNDYRNTACCPVLKDVQSKKRGLECKIQEEHKRAKIMYTIIRNKRSRYFDEFIEIYNKKCAYCGASIGVSDIRLFEIDHFVCKDSFPNDDDGKIRAGRISNLVLACYSCNRGKGSLMIDEDHQGMLNPDDGSIAQVFTRSEDYYICIQSDYKRDQLIIDFYQRLSLGSEFRRLDYLLLEMENVISTLRKNNCNAANRLSQCFIDLMKRRNNTLG